MKIKYIIKGLDCPNCAAKLSAMIENKDGITAAKINFLTEKLTVEADIDEASVYEIVCETARAFSRDIVIEK